MEARINSNDDAGQNSFFVGLDGEPALGDSNYSYDFPIVSVFTWDDVSLRGMGGAAAEFDPMIWDLSQGLHNFTIYGREYNSWLDQIILRGPIHRSDTNLNVCVEIGEMVAFMDRWKISSVDVPMPELMESIGLWKSGEGCS